MEDVEASIEKLRRTYDRTLTEKHKEKLLEINRCQEGRDEGPDSLIIRELLFSLTAVEYEDQEGRWCEVKRRRRAPRCKQAGHARRRRMKLILNRSDQIPKSDTDALIPDASMDIVDKNKSLISAFGGEVESLFLEDPDEVEAISDEL